MTSKETSIILQIIASTYPRQFKDTDDATRALQIKVWTSVFEDETYEEVANALKSYCCHDEGFAPTPGQIKSEIAKLRRSSDMTASEAWAKVRKAISNGTYGAEKEFDLLPADLKKCVGSPAQLRDWANLDTGGLQVAQSNFIKIYERYKESKAAQECLPSSVIAKAKALSSGEPKKIGEVVKQITGGGK